MIKSIKNRRLLGGKKEVAYYTVYYNWENSDVYFDDVHVGTIQDGELTVMKEGKEVKPSFSVTFSGGDSKTQTREYTLTGDTSLSFGSAAETKTPAITSTVKVGTPTHHGGASVTANGSVNLNYTLSYYTEDVGYTISTTGTGFSDNDVSIIASSNESNTLTNPRTGTAIVTLNDSGKTHTISLSLAGRTMYSFTVNSNCIGGTLSLSDGTYIATIPSTGTVTWHHPSSASKTFKISNWSKSSYTLYHTEEDTDTEDGYNYDTETENNCSLSSTSVSFANTGGDKTVTITNKQRTNNTRQKKSRTVYLEREDYKIITYSLPSNTSCSYNSSIEMNYRSNEGDWVEGDWEIVDYGDWKPSGDFVVYSYGTYSTKTPTISDNKDWISTSYSSGTLTITTSENYIDESRSGTVTVTTCDGTARSISATQSKATIELSASESNVYSSNAHSSRTLTITSKINGKNHDCTVKSNDTWITGVSISGLTVTYSVAKNSTLYTSSAYRTGSITVTQTDSKKTATISVRLSHLNFRMTSWDKSSSTNVMSASGTIASSATNIGTVYIACVELDTGVTVGTRYPTCSVSYSLSWLSGSSTYTLSGSGISPTTTANTSTSSRTGKVTITDPIHGKTVTLNVTLSGAAATQYGLYIKNGYTSERSFIISTVSLNGITSALASQCFLTPVPANSKSVLINTATSSKSSPSSTTTIFSSSTLSRSLYIYYLDSSGNVVLASSGSKTNGSTVNC